MPLLTETDAVVGKPEMPDRRKNAVAAMLTIVIAMAVASIYCEYTAQNSMENAEAGVHTKRPQADNSTQLAFGPPIAHRDPIPPEIPGYLHIMPIGDSITWGYDESVSPAEAYAHPPSGYRQYLRALLPRNVQFVGSVEAGPPSSAWCEGHPGIDSQQMAEWFPEWDHLIPADRYLLEIGTNDCWTQESRSSSIASNIKLWREMLAVNPGAIVYVASLPPDRNIKSVPLAWITSYNMMLRKQVELFHNSKVRFVDLYHDAGMTADDLGTTIGAHPTPSGYRKIAIFWARVLKAG